jgi:DNA-binding beta-propeller fold protein YncE
VVGTSTTLNAPRGIAVDMARNQVYIANTGDNSILVFNNARTVTGDIGPSRSISNTVTPIGATGLFIDPVNDRLYVTSSGSVLAYDDVSSLNGSNVTPDRELTGGSTTLSAPTGIFVDTTRNLLYVANGNSQILVFDDASTVNGGSGAPVRTIPISSNTAGIFVDVMADRLYVASGNSILVFDSASTANSSSTPNRTISGGGSMLNQPRDLFVDTGTDRLYVANAGDDSILVFNNASTANNPVAPSRTLSLSASTGSWSVYVDVTPIVIGSTATHDGYVLDDGISVNTDPAGGGPKTGDLEDFLATPLVARQFYSFELTGIPSTISVLSATLRLYQANVEGSPYGAGNLGSIIVDHVNYGSSLDIADYNAIPLTQNIGTLSTDASQAYKTLNVATSAANDILTSRLRSQYRLRFSNENIINTQDDYVQFTDAEDSCCAANRPPQLVITVRP